MRASESWSKHLANIAPFTLDPQVDVDILHRSLLGSNDLGSVVSPSVATAEERRKPEGTLDVIGDPREDKEDRMQELQRFIVPKRVQHEKEKALRIQLEAQLKKTLEFIETHGHHNQMVKDAKSLDFIEGVVCRITACESACRNAQCESPACHLRERLDRVGSEPTRLAAAAGEEARPVQPQPAAVGDSMAVDDRVGRWFPGPEHVETMMCDREVEPQARLLPGSQVLHGLALAASSSSVDHGQISAPSGPQVPHGVAFATSTPSIHHSQPPEASAPSVNRTHRLVDKRMLMDKEPSAVTSLGARATGPSLGASNRFALVGKFPDGKSVSDPLFPNVKDAPSEYSGVAERLAQLEWKNQILLDQAVMVKQTMLKHAEDIREFDWGMWAICDLIPEARPK